MFDIWTVENNLAESVYTKNNYVIENQEVESNLCVIYFSSNNIWFPNTEQAFRKSFIDSDFYEWKNYKHKNASKLIFIRDIYKSWYVEGINIKYNSVVKLAEFLKNETIGMDVITVGSSAGGYAAALFGALLNAKYALCFSAQFDLHLDGCLDKNPFLKRNLSDLNKSKYYNIASIIERARVPIFYFMPAFVKQDIAQMELVKYLENVHTVKIYSRHHGVPVFKCMLGKLLNLPYEELLEMFNKYKDKIISPFIFSSKSVGVFVTVRFIIKESFKQIRKRVIK